MKAKDINLANGVKVTIFNNYISASNSDLDCAGDTFIKRNGKWFSGTNSEDHKSYTKKGIMAYYASFANDSETEYYNKLAAEVAWLRFMEMPH